ncbi:hypothetical protein [Hymenobacter canadensis]|uniref:Uncharacterized protein n=1 Tax=Hymenobacter canadensis TaxID=2999067 RepID=A0ABY7LJW6_9BACT|nr:hypothetical protein [Hymenobacter canadensis]WBA40197.1 hypothetical protein O3303_10165 [Hymenobacter canadensis]
MKDYSLFALLGALLLLSSCQSQQAFLFRPTVATHSSAAGMAREPLEPASEHTAIPVPELTAELPIAASNSPAKYSRAHLPPVRPTATEPITNLVQPAALRVAPDTALVRPAADIPLHKIKETSNLTKVVRALGVLLLLFGAVLFLVPFFTSLPGWTFLAYFLYGLLVMLLSLPLLIFRSKNSPRQQELERRRAARKAAAGR